MRENPAIESLVADSAMRLLVVEDDREAAEYLKKALREAGHVAEIAGDGEAGLALALDGDFDVLVVDRMLPKTRRALAGGGAAREGPSPRRC